MQVLIAVSCLLAVASAGYVSHNAYTYPTLVHTQHLPVIGPNGVPLDEPAVALAKAEHAAAHLEAKTRNGGVALYAHQVATPLVYAAPVSYASHYESGHYYGPQHLPVIGANGVPVEEPAVVAARAQHAAAHLEAKTRDAHVAVVAAPVLSHVAGPVPVDTVEVAAAKAAHCAAHAEAKARNGLYHHYAPLVHYRKRRGVLAYTAPVAHIAHVAHYTQLQHLPVIGANGVPLDEPAVVAARAQHAAHHLEAKVRNGDAALVAPVHYTAAHVAAPLVAHVAGPVVPAETPEVVAARAAHYAAHLEAKVRNGDLHLATPLIHAY